MPDADAATLSEHYQKGGQSCDRRAGQKSRRNCVVERGWQKRISREISFWAQAEFERRKVNLESCAIFDENRPKHRQNIQKHVKNR